jgi:hypothetical protein
MSPAPPFRLHVSRTIMTADTVVSAVLAACPTSLDAWTSHLRWWGDDERGDYNDVAVFAHHIVNSANCGSTVEFPAFFELLERMIQQGDPHVKQLAVIGLIEDIQNIASHRPGGYTTFETWLRPATRTAWREVEAAWLGVGSLAEIVRRETGGK